MTESTAALTIDVHLTEDEWFETISADCLEGLTASPKRLSPVWFYDEDGSNLFDDITRLDEYYPTRAEATLLADHAERIVDLAGADTLVELGSGTSDKTEHLLDAMAAADTLERYVPFDVSGETVRAAADRLLDRYDGLSIHAVVGDFNRHLGDVPRDGRRLVAFLGGTIGNFGPESRRRFLFDLDCVMSSDDRLLLGCDLVKDADVLVEAYDDAAGVTAAFNRNALAHVNDRLGADFVPEQFDHVARWNADESWIEMRLRSTCEQDVDLGELGATIHFAEGEEMRTEISAKFTPEGITAELWESGFVVEETWTVEPGYLLTLARPYC
ncbi:L-histidine N(alpha)-methyltransferase [Actinospongicola halichondriae]|uniref:L-histidine N(alpha)-methyltransferase n=1 Tax=Actinospongicola halichondriae TaxID=3236844 RepID=UPI003D4CB088